MKYEVTRACIIKGTNHKVGQIVELDDQLANQLMGIGRVAPADESKLEDRSIGLDVETKPKRRSRKKAETIVEEVVEDVVEAEGDE